MKLKLNTKKHPAEKQGAFEKLQKVT